MRLRLKVIALLLLSTGLAPAKVHTMSDEAIRTTLRNHLAGQGDYAQRFIRRLGNKTIELEAYISTDGDFSEVPKIMSNLARYPAWALENINKSPTGGKYHLNVKGLKANSEKSLLTFLYSLELPIFKHEGELTVKLMPETSKGVFTLNVEMPADEKSLLQKSETVIKVYPADNDANRLWIYILGQTSFKSWIVYEGLPEKLVSRESGERLQIIVTNYLKEEDLVKNERTKQVTVKEGKAKEGRKGGG